MKYLIENDFSWKVFKPIARLGMKFNSIRKKHERSERHKNLNYHHIFRNLEVLNGPFKGMRYPDNYAVGSTIYPKLLGSYESELHSVFKEFASNDYTEILDIGCAEGYYAVGLAMHFKDSKVYAYDIDANARNSCLKMASINNVTNIEVKSNCTPEILKSFKFESRALIICDCEGFEKELFSSNNLNNLKNCDLIIEMHDFKNIHISNHLKKLFEHSHQLESIYSVDDIQKALNYDYKELLNVSLEIKKYILGERRPAIMEWLICRVKN